MQVTTFEGKKIRLKSILNTLRVIEYSELTSFSLQEDNGSDNQLWLLEADMESGENYYFIKNIGGSDSFGSDQYLYEREIDSPTGRKKLDLGEKKVVTSWKFKVDQTLNSFVLINKLSGNRLSLLVTSGEEEASIISLPEQVGDMAQGWLIEEAEGDDQFDRAEQLNLKAFEDQIVSLRSNLNIDKTLDLGADIGINLWDYSGGNNQLWLVEAVAESEVFKLKNVSNGSYLTDVGNDVTLGLSNGEDATSSWLLESGAADGFYIIVNSATGRVMDVSGSATANGTAVISYIKTGTPNQEWQLSSSEIIPQKEDIYRFDLHTDPTLPIFNENQAGGMSALTSEIYLSLSSIKEIDTASIKEVSFSEFLTGVPLDEFGRLYGISEKKTEWLHPLHQGVPDPHTIIYHLTLEFRPNPGEALGLIRIPQIAAHVTFSDNSTIGSWVNSGDDLELSTPAFIFEHQLSVSLYKEDSLEVISLQRKLAEQYDNKIVYIRSWMDNYALDDSDSNDDLILFNFRQTNNQKWTMHFRSETDDFYFTCMSNNYNFYESDSIGLGNKIMTGDSILVNGVEDARARWRLLEAGTMDDGTALYKLKNRRSGNVLTFQSYIGNRDNPGAGSPLITNPDYGNKNLQEFRFTLV